MTETVLVTGGTGFVAGWCIAELLQRGYAVRTTVRSLAKEPRGPRGDRAAGGSGPLTVAAADLTARRRLGRGGGRLRLRAARRLAARRRAAATTTR